MVPALALPVPHRLTDLLSSAAPARAKRSREPMDQPRTDEDQPLVARAQSGDAAAFDELVVKYSPRLYGLVYNMTSNHEDTNDMLQDVFAKAYRAIKGFRGKSSFYTWIHTIAVNMTLNFLKKRGRRYHLSLDDTLCNAGGFLQRGASAVKLEGGAKRVETVQALVECEIPVMGHLGLTPQSVHAMGGFKVQGRGAQDGAGSRPFRAPKKIERGDDEAV